MLGSNLQLPAYELIFPNSFYETLNKGKTVPLNILNILPSALANNFGKVQRKCSKVLCLTLACAFADNEFINQKRQLCGTRLFVRVLTLME